MRKTEKVPRDGYTFNYRSRARVRAQRQASPISLRRIIRLIVSGQWQSQRPFLESRARAVSAACPGVRHDKPMKRRMKTRETSKSHLAHAQALLCARSVLRSTGARSTPLPAPPLEISGTAFCPLVRTARVPALDDRLLAGMRVTRRERATREEKRSPRQPAAFPFTRSLNSRGSANRAERSICHRQPRQRSRRAR